MEKVNIIDILKDAPHQVTLFSPCFGFVCYKQENQTSGIPDDAIRTCPASFAAPDVTFDKDGKVYEVKDHDGVECMLFPDDIDRSWDNWAPHLVAYGDWVVLKDGTICQFDAEEHEFAFVQRWANTEEIAKASQPQPQPEESQRRAAEKRVVLFDNVAVFDHVLVRDDDGDIWVAGIIVDYKEKNFKHFVESGGCCWRQCIPYAGNEHLRGTTTTPKKK